MTSSLPSNTISMEGWPPYNSLLLPPCGVSSSNISGKLTTKGSCDVPGIDEPHRGFSSISLLLVVVEVMRRLGA